MARLGIEDATAYARRFACLADPTRVRLMHAVATAPGGLTVGELSRAVAIGQSTCSRHLAVLAEAGLVRRRRRGTATVITVDGTCRTGLPHAADLVTGILAARAGDATVPAGVTLRPMRTPDFAAVRRIYRAGIETGDATFETAVPSRRVLEEHWLPGHRWVAELDGRIAGWSALAAASSRECYRGVA